MNIKRLMTSVMSISLCAIILITTGCASIVSKSQYPVTINSNPSGAAFTVKDEGGTAIHNGTTPETMTLSASKGFFRPASYSFEFNKDGDGPDTVSMSAGLDGWYIGNLVFGGLIGFLIVDPATGAMWRLDDHVYGNVSAAPKSSSSSKKDAEKSVADRLKQLKKLKESGVLTEDEYESKREALIKKL